MSGGEDGHDTMPRCKDARRALYVPTPLDEVFRRAPRATMRAVSSLSSHLPFALMRLALLLAILVAVPATAQTPDAVSSETDAALARATDRATWAPTARGVRLLGGYASAGGFGSGGFSASVGPTVGRFVRDGLSLSLGVGVGASQSTFTGLAPVGSTVLDPEYRSRFLSLGIGPSVTQYFGRTGAAAYPFVGVSAQGSWQRYSSGLIGEAPTTGSGWSLGGGARAGVMVPVARNVSIEAQVIGNLYDDGNGGVDGNVGFTAGIATFLY